MLAEKSVSVLLCVDSMRAVPDPESQDVPSRIIYVSLIGWWLVSRAQFRVHDILRAEITMILLFLLRSDPATRGWDIRGVDDGRTSMPPPVVLYDQQAIETDPVRNVHDNFFRNQ